MKDLLGGGACNPDGSQMTHSSNPLRNFVQQVFLGKSRMGEKLQQWEQNEPIMRDMITRPGDFQNEWDLMANQFDGMKVSGREMHRIFQEEQIAYDEMRRVQEMEARKAWEHAQIMERKHHEERIMMEKQMSDHWKQAELMREANDWKDDFVQEGLDKEFEEQFAKAQQLVDKNVNEQQVIKESANYMVEVMQNDPDPRFKDSKLLNFLKRLEKGDYEIKDNQLIKHVDGEQLENAWGEAKMENVWNKANMENTWEETKMEHKMENAWEKEEQKIDDPEQDTEKVFDKIWAKFQAGEIPSVEHELEEEFKKIQEQMEKIGQGNEEDIFSDMWNVQQDIEEYQAYGDVPEAYTFSVQNQYANDPKALETASNLLNQGNTKNAILALEAHLQKNPSDANSWRVLGKIHMDNDQDRPAVRCFLNSININGKNLDTLFALGVSCTNIFDEVQAMNHLKHWMMNNPKYQDLINDPNIIPENLIGQSLDIQQIKEMNGRLLERFEAAKQINPSDSELSTCLAVLNFIKRDYHTSVHYWNDALQYDPNNYSLWNKLGATLAHLGRAEEAMEAYHRALEFKPNYVRTWVNLGIAHAFKGEFEDAARFYLSALAMNPEAQHVWSYLQTTLLSLQRYDLLKLVAERDIEGFRKEFDIVLLEQLPESEIGYKQINEQFLVKEKNEEWLKEFQG